MALSPEEKRRQYELEKKLARGLMAGTPAERPGLYAEAYQEFHRTFPNHELLTRHNSPELTHAAVQARMLVVGPFLNRDTVFVELGAGDCSLSLEVARHVKSAVAVEVSNAVAPDAAPPPNFRLQVSDALSFRPAPSSVDVVYSNDFVEHLHPEDALELLRGVHAMLRPGGVCLCLTPNRLGGPHDISGAFDKVATGLHLKEYTVSELKALFRKAGFLRARLIVLVRRRFFILPAWPVILCEYLLAPLPRALVVKLAARFPLRHLLGVNLVGVK